MNTGDRARSGRGTVHALVERVKPYAVIGDPTPRPSVETYCGYRVNGWVALATVPATTPVTCLRCLDIGGALVGAPTPPEEPCNCGGAWHSVGDHPDGAS